MTFDKRRTLKQIILGTAGHIDHGKTSLIKALTGTDTDRLKEEKLRGITIELGFAAIDLPSGQHLGIVDVPGHEKFVKNMVAGATGIDMVVMVIAADEGVMPQTKEHMEICSLLDIRYGLVALTKVDMVEQEWLELVREDVKDFTKGTFLEDAPILPVSSATKDGLDNFIAALDQLSGKITKKKPTSLFRLPVDRVFSMKGFGTVITGTLISGKVSVGDTVQLYPAMITSKVRGLQVHNESVETATAGLRTAINFQGLEKEAVNRGDILAHPTTLASSYMVDLAVHYLMTNKKALKNRTQVRFHTGSSEILGNLVLLDREELLPGDHATTQIRLDAPVALVKDDRFVLRSYSPVRTIGGGAVLNPIARKHKRFKPEIVAGLTHLATATAQEIIAYHLLQSKYSGVSFSHLLLMTALSEKQLQADMQALLSNKTAILVDKEQRIFIHGENFEKYKTNANNYLNAYHKRYPLKAGMPKEELKSKFPKALEGKLFTLALNQLVKEKTVITAEDVVRLSDHKVALAEDQEDVRNKIEKIYQKSRLTPPYFKEVIKTLNVKADIAKQVLQLLIAEGALIKVKEDLFYHTKNLDELKTRLVDFLLKNKEISTPQFKDMTGASRKYVIPLIEFFDASNITIRVGDMRRLRKQN
jgi:selenocysteine-specific elongation factor